MAQCKICGSHAFNLRAEGIDQGELCDRHYWQEAFVAKTEELNAAYLELRKIRPAIKAIFDRDVWDKAAAYK